MFLSSLPLDNLPADCAEDDQLSFAWESIDYWAERILIADEADRESSLRFHASPLMLACYFVLLRIRTLVAQKFQLSARSVNIVRIVVTKASNEIRGFESVKKLYENPQTDSFKESAAIARNVHRSIYEREKNSLRQDTVVSQAQQTVASRLYRLLELYIALEPRPAVLPSSKVRDWQKFLKRVDTPLKRPSSVIEIAEIQEVDKRIRLGEWAKITLTQGEADIVDPYFGQQSLVPMHGKIGSSISVGHGDLMTATAGQRLNDAVIDAYLSLIGHSINGHFGSNDLAQTPRWHMWPTLVLETLRAGNSPDPSWPPQMYPQARITEVEKHVLAVHVQGNHWALIVIDREITGLYNVRGFSSVPGYEQSMGTAWQLFRRFLGVKGLDLGSKDLSFPAGQPQQTNSYDCGMFVLAIVRAQYEGWPMSSIKGHIMPDFRRRVIADLRTWRLN